MNGLLNVTTKILAFGDSAVSSNPRLKFVDWYRDMAGTPVADPQSESHSIAPGGSKVVFDGVFASGVDGTTAFDLELSSLDASRYRMTWSGGTDPAFRTGRSLALNGVAVTLTANPNATLTVTTPTPQFASVAVGDEVFIPHTTTGDAANVISVLNAGRWTVLGKASNSSITLVKPVGFDFEGVTQTVTLSDNAQFRAYSATGLQIGDSVDISAGFALATRKIYTVEAVTDTFIEFISTTPIAEESGIIPTASGIAFFTSNKSFVYVEANQECAVRVNGDTGNFQRLSPPDPSNALAPAQYMRRGPTWSMTIVNLSAVTVDVTVIHCE